MRPKSRQRILRMDNLFRKPPPSIKFAQAHLSAGGYVGNRALLSTCDHGCTGTSFESEKTEGRGQRASAFLLPSPGSAVGKCRKTRLGKRDHPMTAVYAVGGSPFLSRARLALGRCH